MKKNIMKYNMIIVTFVLCFAILGGCGKKVPETVANKTQSPTVQTSETPKPTTTAQAATTAATATSSPKPTSKSVLSKQLPIYTINDESLECEAAVAMIPEDSKVTAKLIVNTVVDNLAEHSLKIGIDKVTVDGDKVIVSFKDGYAPLVNVGAGVESTILDCISNSLLDNLSSCKKVIFREEGKKYESGHIDLGYDEVYAWKQ